jgi:hypothetical protein
MNTHTEAIRAMWLMNCVQSADARISTAIQSKHENLAVAVFESPLEPLDEILGFDSVSEVINIVFITDFVDELLAVYDSDPFGGLCDFKQISRDLAECRARVYVFSSGRKYTIAR